METIGAGQIIRPMGKQKGKNKRRVRLQNKTASHEIADTRQKLKITSFLGHDSLRLGSLLPSCIVDVDHHLNERNSFA